MSKLKTLVIRDATYLVDSLSGQSVFHVRDPHALVQAAGYLKFVLADGPNSLVYSRGQTRLHNGLIPALFRGCKSPATRAKLQGRLNVLLKDARSAGTQLALLDEPIVEPLLQHYGVKTTWVDLVDNIWIALWFACHSVRASGAAGEFFHYERREPRHEAPEARFGYVVLVAADVGAARATAPGRYRGPTTEVVDLRMAVPSIFLRPHAQHGVLFRLRGAAGSRPLDYRSAIAGVIRVDLEDALAWLGSGNLLTVHSLFPPPAYDLGYANLLEDFHRDTVPVDSVVGSIAHVGA